jgi:para-aminobenzoate synthetase component 1
MDSLGALDFDPLRGFLPRVATVGGPGFPGGAVGFLTYEEGWGNEGLTAPAVEPGLHGWFGVYDTFAAWNPATDEVEIVSWGLTPDGDFDARAALHRATELEERLRFDPGTTAATAPLPVPPSEVRSSLGRAEHARGVAAILEAIERGDIYQGNLTSRFDVDWPGDAAELFARLLRENPAPHAALLEADDVTIVSCSPERLLAARGRDVESRPIKGTAPRDPEPALDRLRADELLASPKDRAELLMITDLVRNDLGKVCAPGSVRVPRLRDLESFPHVHHLVSTVRGRLPAGVDALHALAALFPAGSVVGCPKRRALEILGELEGAPRGVYTGTVGWVGFDQSCDFNVAIRTGWLRDGVFSFGAGGGIVVDSDPVREWDELGWKARAIADALGAALEPAVRGSEP